MKSNQAGVLIWRYENHSAYDVLTDERCKECNSRVYVSLTSDEKLGSDPVNFCWQCRLWIYK